MHVICARGNTLGLVCTGTKVAGRKLKRTLSSFTGQLYIFSDLRQNVVESEANSTADERVSIMLQAS